MVNCLIAMDCDGTIEGRGGPVPVMLVNKVAFTPGHRIVRIGDHVCAVLFPYMEGPEDEHGLPVSGIGYGKSRYLAELKEKYPTYQQYLVVDDEPSQYSGGWVGWTMMSPQQFVERFG